MSDEPSISLDEACDRTLFRWGKQPEDIVEPCTYGHFDCSYRYRGPCMNEANAEEFAKADREAAEQASA